MAAQLPAITVAGLADRPGDGFTAVGRGRGAAVAGGTVLVELDTSGTVDVARRTPPAGEGPGRRAEGAGQTTAKLGNEAFLAKAPDAVVDKIRARQQLAGEEVERITARLAALQ